MIMMMMMWKRMDDDGTRSTEKEMNALNPNQNLSSPLTQQVKLGRILYCILNQLNINTVPGKGCMTVLMLRDSSPDSILSMAEFNSFRYTGVLCRAL